MIRWNYSPQGLLVRLYFIMNKLHCPGTISCASVSVSCQSFAVQACYAVLQKRGCSPARSYPSSTTTPSKTCTTTALNVSDSTVSTARRKAKPTASEPSKPPQSWSSGSKSRFTPIARTSTGAPLLTCCCRMGRTSITNWSRTAGAGGTGSMRQGMRYLKS